jgi:hypothetical protein
LPWCVLRRHSSAIAQDKIAAVEKTFLPIHKPWRVL